MKEYLGDGVYVKFYRYTKMICLTTEYGISVTNKIYLEREVMAALKREAALAKLTTEEQKLLGLIK